MTRALYDPSLLGSIPPEVLEAARRVSDYFAENNIRGWSLYNCADRAHFVVDGNAWTPDEDRYAAVVTASARPQSTDAPE